MFRHILDALDRPLTARSASVGCAALVVLYLLLMAVAAAGVREGLMPTGDPAGQDFSNFYAAGELTRAGRPADVYPLDAFQAQLRHDHAGIRATYIWNYPPPMAMLAVGLTAAPYLVALVAWTALSLGLFIGAARILAPHPRTWLAALAAPAAFWDAWHHQVGCLSAALLALGFFYSSSRQLRGGLLVGVMIIKPHLAVAAPFVFLAGRRWISFVGAAITSLGLCALSYLWLGPQVWTAFLHYAPRGRALLEGGGQLQSLMPSVFVALRMLHAPVAIAYLAHGLVAVTALAVASLVWARNTDPRVRTAAALAACSLISPYTFAYDTTLTALGVAAIGGTALQRPMPTGTVGLMTLAWFWPLPASAVAFLYQIQLGWLAPIAVLAVAVADTVGRPGEQPFPSLDNKQAADAR